MSNLIYFILTIRVNLTIIYRNDISKENMMLKYIVLGTLFSNTLTGYDIRKCIESGIGMFYRASYGSIYPILSKLLEDKNIVCIDEAQGKRVKKKYSITEGGKEEFMNWLKKDDNINSTESFMAKVFFFDKLTHDLAFRKISVYEEKLQHYMMDLILKKKEYEKLDNKDAFYFKLSTLYFGICKLQSILVWCDNVKHGNDLEALISPVKEEGI